MKQNFFPEEAGLKDGDTLHLSKVNFEFVSREVGVGSWGALFVANKIRDFFQGFHSFFTFKDCYILWGVYSLDIQNT